jgi:Uma2 family endonuclease
MALTLEDPPIPAPGKCVVLNDVTWERYEQLRDETDAAGSHVRITYDQGRMALMSPLPSHEKVKTMTGGFIELAAVELDIPCARLGSTTWKRRDLRKGLEADECYYVQHEAQVRNKTKFDLTRDPPPDLAIEVDITHHPLDRPSIYGALGVNELWRYDGRQMHFLKLGEDGRYHPIEASEAFPVLTPAVINRFIAMIGTVGDTQLMREFRDWLRSLPQRK